MNNNQIAIATMNGSYVLTKESIKKNVIPDKDGNYRTGYLKIDGSFIPKYTGRGNVFKRLNDHIDEGFVDSHFQFVYEPNAVKSYLIESADYHRFQSQLTNSIHPRKPDDFTNVACPYCGA